MPTPPPASEVADIPPTFRLGEPADVGVDVSLEGDDVVVAVRGELDVLTAPFLWERVEPVLPGLVGRLVFDLAGTRFIDSMGLAVLVRAHSRLRPGPSPAPVVVRSINDHGRKILGLTGLDRLLTVEG